MTRVERIGGAELWLGDCREVLAELPRNAAIVSDPPYGMRLNTDSTRFSGLSKRGPGRNDWGAVIGDGQPFDPQPWLEWPECILWGCNHFGRHLPGGTTLIWIKKTPGEFGHFLSDAEVAWMKGGHGVYCFLKARGGVEYLNRGEDKYHPCEKPLELMLWCVEKIKAGTVIDPYMGSGTTGVACARLGRRFIGVEIDPGHFATACRRIEQAQRQADLFIAPAVKPVQASLFADAAA